MRSVVQNEGQLRGAFSAFAAAMAPGKPYEIYMKPFRRRRTLDQNAKMHAMIRTLALHLGYSESEMKNVLKSEYGPVVKVELGDRQVIVPKSTADYDVAECGEMIEIINMVGAETGCAFEDPEDAEGGDGGGS